MSINERIKEVRKYFKLSQKEIADKIGMSQNAISWSEKNGNNVPDSTIKSLCTVLNVNEDFLRNGIEPMIIKPDNFSLDKFIVERGGTDLEKEIIKTYFELDPEVRKAIFDHFSNKFFPKPKRNPLLNGIPDTPEELEEMYQVIDVKDKKDIG